VLRDYLNRQIERGRLRPHDVATWAQVFIGLATGLVHMKALLALPDEGDGTQAEHVRTQIISMYVRAHGVGGSD
jgi:hypothetical protein